MMANRYHEKDYLRVPYGAGTAPALLVSSGDDLRHCHAQAPRGRSSSSNNNSNSDMMRSRCQAYYNNNNNNNCNVTNYSDDVSQYRKRSHSADTRQCNHSDNECNDVTAMESSGSSFLERSRSPSDAASTRTPRASDTKARNLYSELSHRHLDKLHRDLFHGSLNKSVVFRSSMPDLRSEEAKRRTSMRLERLTSLDADVRKAEQVIAKVKALSASNECMDAVVETQRRPVERLNRCRSTEV